MRSMWIVLFLASVGLVICVSFKQDLFPTDDPVTKAPPKKHHRRGESQGTDQASNQHRRLQSKSSSIELFSPSIYTVVGPSSFPKPSARLSNHVKPNLHPTIGQHRASQDSVFVLSVEYKLSTYLLFVTSLRKTGYTGDIVFAISQLDMKDRETRAFLESSPNIIVYVLDLTCFNAEMEETESSKGGMRVCQLDGIYADAETGQPLKDPREARTIATTRYELYWLWSLQYDPHQWLMLLDARDSYFQTNPFDTVTRETDPNAVDGVLHFFGENIDATRIGLSAKNRKWLTNAYGDVVVAALEKKPTICSGSTMGETVAIETYLRAMVAESDETGTKLMGADQGFHNYLYYSNKLLNADTIRTITVFDQGRGAINNLGAMRTANLTDWGNGHILDYRTNISMTVLNWDGTISPVMHQFDRHKTLSIFIYKYMASVFHEEYLASKRMR